MLLVVYSHVLVYMCHTPSALNSVFMIGRMPLFFFISGFFAWSYNFDSKTFRRRLTNRLTRQLYPTLLVFLIFALGIRRVYHDPLRNLDYALHDPLKFGYWFTISLVEVYVVYALAARGMDHYGLSKRARFTVMGILAVISAIPTVTGFPATPPDGTTGHEIHSLLSIGKTLSLAPYFFLGAMAKMGGEKFLDAAASSHFLQCTLTCTALGGAAVLSGRCGVLSGCASLFGGVSMLLLLFSIFSNLRTVLTAGNPVADALATVGRATLPVYLFHYFMVVGCNRIWPEAGKWLAGWVGNPWLEIPVIGGVSAIIVMTVLFADRMLARVPYAHKAIFAS